MKKKAPASKTPKKYVSTVQALRDKESIARQALRRTFLVYIHAPDEDENRQGFLLAGGPLPVQVHAAPLFAAYCVGASQAQLDQLIGAVQFFASDIRERLDEQDVNDMAMTRALKSWMQLILERGSEPRAITAEIVIRGPQRMIPIRFNGDFEIRPYKTDESSCVFLAGSHDQVFRNEVIAVIKRAVGGMPVGADTAKIAQKALEKKFPNISRIEAYLILAAS